MNTEQLQALTADKVVDARGTACPGPLLAAKRSITEVAVGGVMEVVSSDESTGNDIPRWCKKLHHEFLGIVEEDGYWRIFIKRAR